MQHIAKYLDLFNRFIGKAAAWLIGAMVLVMFCIVVLRYGFDIGWIGMQESVLYLHALAFMLGLAYTLSEDAHVRVDIFYQRLSARGRAIIDCVGVIFLLLPMCGFIVYQSSTYVLESWKILESSPEAGGLPGVFLLKSLIPLSAVMLCMQGISMLLVNIARISKKPGALN